MLHLVAVYGAVVLVHVLRADDMQIGLAKNPAAFVVQRDLRGYWNVNGSMEQVEDDLAR